jgi:hypothetical protein
LCTKQEPWLDLQGQSARTAAGLGVDASSLAASFFKNYFYVSCEDQRMKKGKSNFKAEFKQLVKQISYEIIISILLGSLPVAIYATNAQTLDDIVAALLASGSLIDYAGCLIIPYLLATFLRWAIQFKSEDVQAKLVYFHKITTEIGTSFLSIIRTGLGTMIGILIIALTTDIITLTPGDYIGLIGSTLCVLIVSSGLAIFHDLLAKHANFTNSNNPLKFDRSLKR